MGKPPSYPLEPLCSPSPSSQTPIFLVQLYRNHPNPRISLFYSLLHHPTPYRPQTLPDSHAFLLSLSPRPPTSSSIPFHFGLSNLKVSHSIFIIFQSDYSLISLDLQLHLTNGNSTTAPSLRLTPHLYSSLIQRIRRRHRRPSSMWWFPKRGLQIQLEL